MCVWDTTLVNEALIYSICFHIVQWQIPIYSLDLANVISVCVVNVHSVAEDYEFGEYDKIHHVNEKQQETTLLPDTTPSHYLNHRVVYANTISKEETKL